MIILLHSSKTMKRANEERKSLRPPQLLEKAKRLDAYLKTLSSAALEKVMKISPVLAEETQERIAEWSAAPEVQTLAIDSFIGDIYSGLHANDLSGSDRDYADETLRILSGLYGILRPYDGICPYRLEMGYKLPDPAFASLYDYWGGSIAATLPIEVAIINLAALEYAQTVIRFVDPARIVAPKFYTVNPKTGKAEFVVVHAKIARGAFARWLITNRIKDIADLVRFDDLGYRYEKSLNTDEGPAFVCEAFGGKGRSIKLL